MRPGDEAALRTVAGLGANAKVRCGGATPDMYPSPGELAGLHHGLPRRRPALQGHRRACHPLRDGIVHGFLDLLAASVLAHVGGAGERELADVLLADEPDAFTFTDDAFRVAGREFGAEEIAATAASCSWASAAARSQSRSRT